MKDRNPEKEPQQEPAGDPMLPFAAQALTDQERELLKAFVQSPAYPLIKKLCENGIFYMYRQLEQAKETKDFYLLQGQIRGLRFSQNAPLLAAEAYDAKLRREAEAEARKRIRGPMT